MRITTNKLVLVGMLAFGTCFSANAQRNRPSLSSLPAAVDSVTKVYTFVQYMPLYQGEEGTQKITKDLLREFRTACVASGCAVPDFLVVVKLTVEPSGVIHDVMSLNNMPIISQAQFDAGAKGIVGARPDLKEMPAACEAALVAAARKLPRLTPGALNGRRVAVGYTLKLADVPK